MYILNAIGEHSRIHPEACKDILLLYIAFPDLPTDMLNSWRWKWPWDLSLLCVQQSPWCYLSVSQCIGCWGTNMLWRTGPGTVEQTTHMKSEADAQLSSLRHRKIFLRFIRLGFRFLRVHMSCHFLLAYQAGRRPLANWLQPTQSPLVFSFRRRLKQSNEASWCHEYAINRLLLVSIFCARLLPFLEDTHLYLSFLPFLFSTNHPSLKSLQIFCHFTCRQIWFQHVWKR